MACIQLDFADPVAGEASCYSLSKYDLLHPDTLAAMQIHSTRRRLEKKTRDKNYHIVDLRAAFEREYHIVDLLRNIIS